MSVVKEYLGDQFPEDILEKVAELEAKIISGEIEVPTAMGMPVEEWEEIKASVALKTN